MRRQEQDAESSSPPKMTSTCKIFFKSINSIQGHNDVERLRDAVVAAKSEINPT